MTNSYVIDVADLKPAGSEKTYRQLNAEKAHRIPLGALVELRRYNSDLEEDEDDPFGLRLYVVGHTRDCDQTPLYTLSYKTLDEYLKALEFLEGSRLEVHGRFLMKATIVTPALSGYPEESLKVLHVAPPND